MHCRGSTSSSPKRRRFASNFSRARSASPRNTTGCANSRSQLDQCWDLLRQRRALRETGGDPGEAEVRPADEVEGYLN